MTILLFILVLTSVILILHINKQKKSVMMHNDVANSLLMQLAIENQKKQVLIEKTKINCTFNTDLKINILKKQVQLLEIISNQPN